MYVKDQSFTDIKHISVKLTTVRAVFFHFTFYNIHSNIFYCSYTVGLQTSFANLRAAHLTYNNKLIYI